MNRVEQQIAEILPDAFDAPAEAESRQVRRHRERTDAKARDRVLSRVRAYLDATPPAIEGQGGDAHTFQVACRVVRGFDLDDADALDLLRDWNQRCVPPWSEAELIAKIEGARKYGDEPIGGRLDEPHQQAATEITTGTTPPDAVEAVFVDDLPEPQQAPGNLNLTDSGNAEYFNARYGQDVRYDHRRGRYLLWRPPRWQPDADAEIRRLAKAAMRERFKDATLLVDLDAKARLAKWAIASESRARIDALLYLAQAEIPIADAGDRWDADPWRLGVLNGEVDLRTGTLLPGRRESRITMSTAVPFEPTAAHPRWTRFLHEIFAGDEELIGFVRRAVGYSLTGITSEQCLIVLYGTGANGKTTFVITLKHVLADYSFNMPFATIEMKDRAAIPNDLAALVGRRFVVASETNDGTRLNESRIKALTGCDPLTARFLHQEFFTFEPIAKFWLSVNHRPVVRDDSHGFWRRIRLVPFSQQFEPNPTLVNELKVEAPGILAWAVQACLEWQRDGLNPPAAVLDATREYERDSDPLGDFIDQALDREPESEIWASDLYDHYCAWAKEHGLNDRERLTATAFGRKMSERFPTTRRNGRKVYIDLARRVS